MLFSKHKFMYGYFFKTQIFPIYLEHERTFDRDGIHGVLHIARSIIAGHILAQKCIEQGNEVDILSILVAIAFHDSGRKGNGEDLWEQESSNNCLAFLSGEHVSHLIRGLKESIKTQEDAKYTASLILKTPPDANDMTYMCVHDSDVLEIMRPCTGKEGILGFKRDNLLLRNHFDKNDMELIIKEWWKFIGETEAYKDGLSVEDCIDRILYLITEEKYPVLFNLLA